MTRQRLLQMGLLCAAALVSPLGAQPTHLPPPEIGSVRSGQVLLELTVPKDDTCEKLQGATRSFDGSCGHALVQGGQIGVRDGRLFVTRAGSDVIEVTLRDRTVKDVVNELAKKKGVKAYSAYPDVPADLIAEFEPVAIPEQSGGRRGRGRNPVFAAEKMDNPIKGQAALPVTRIRFQADPNRPTLAVALGVVYSMDARPDEPKSNLLSQGGFQVDLLGASPRWRAFQFRGRMGVSSNEGFHEATRVSEKDLTGFISTAEQFSLLGESLMGPWADDHLAVAVDMGANWAVLPEFSFPNVVLTADSMGTEVSAVLAMKSVAPEAVLDRASDELRSRIPLAQYTVSTYLRLPGRGKTVWYAGLGLGAREILARSVHVTNVLTGDSIRTTLRPPTDSAAVPAAVRTQPLEVALDPLVETPYKFGYRIMLGFVFEGAVELRADVFSPIHDRDAFDPLVRVVVAKPFKFKGK